MALIKVETLRQTFDELDPGQRQILSENWVEAIKSIAMIGGSQGVECKWVVYDDSYGVDDTIALEIHFFTGRNGVPTSDLEAVLDTMEPVMKQCFENQQKEGLLPYAYAMGIAVVPIWDGYYRFFPETF